jgi:hypothetical protein
MGASLVMWILACGTIAPRWVAWQEKLPLAYVSRAKG